METFANKVQANNTVVRLQQRVAAVQAMRASKNAARRHAVQQQAFLLQVNEAAQAQGIAPEQVQKMLGLLQGKGVRKGSVAQANELITVVTNGVSEQLRKCKAVHAICNNMPTATRSEQVTACMQHGINEATAQTQVAIWRKAAAEQRARQH